jgi:hypothetical protein
MGIPFDYLWPIGFLLLLPEKICYYTANSEKRRRRMKWGL